MLSGVFAFSWSKWSASPALGRRQFVMRAAEWEDAGGAGTDREVRGAYDGGGGGGVIWTDQELDFNLCWNLPAVCETSVLCTAHLSPLPLPLPPSPLSLLLPAACLVLDGWRRQELQVGFERRGR